ncbi:hypothetical protein [Candidatus Solirubrobacter pratensis]|uniref:hypothetical protein n=1 Tax=Candidatus Solirubrobacter pratensis TaxID=1298857 RepID=UPI0012DCC0B9|nr:hypothetical protein [Candidatus Solirubrobacter pratensis]
MFLDYPRYPETRVATILRRTREPGYEGRPIAWVQAKGRYETISTNSNLLADHQRGTMNPVRRGLEGATSGILLVASEKCPELVPELTRIEDAYRREIRELRADNDALLLTLRVVHRDPQGQKVLSAALDRACEEFSDELPALPPGPSAPYGDGAVG